VALFVCGFQLGFPMTNGLKPLFEHLFFGE
jgi:hypothetical protein